VILVGIGIVAYNVWRAAFVWRWFDQDGWYDRAGEMMDAREKPSGD